MLREIYLFGGLAPSLLLYGVTAIPLFLLVDRLSLVVGFYRLVWNPPLVRLALFVCILSGMVLITRPEGVLP
jgi:hypothetical protein